jgi:hypothetical protein
MAEQVWTFTRSQLLDALSHLSVQFIRLDDMADAILGHLPGQPGDQVSDEDLIRRAMAVAKDHPGHVVTVAGGGSGG